MNSGPNSIVCFSWDAIAYYAFGDDLIVGRTLYQMGNADVRAKVSDAMSQISGHIRAFDRRGVYLRVVFPPMERNGLLPQVHDYVLTGKLPENLARRTPGLRRVKYYRTVPEEWEAGLRGIAVTTMAVFGRAIFESIPLQSH